VSEVTSKIQRYKCVIEYEGTHYFGWQKQANTSETIQTKIETALFNFSHQQIEIFGSGRTDAGVHALGKVAHFDFDHSHQDYEPFKILEAINAHLRDTRITVLAIEKAAPDFHARFDAKQRSYDYHILNRYARPTFNKNIITHVPYSLSLSKMQAAAEYLIGTHDLSSFRARHCQAKSPVKSIDTITITQNGDHIVFHISAKSFLHHQIRNMVGTLCHIGSNKWPVEKMSEIIAARDRRVAGPTAPPNGLFFKEIIY